MFPLHNEDIAEFHYPYSKYYLTRFKTLCRVFKHGPNSLMKYVEFLNVSFLT